MMIGKKSWNGCGDDVFLASFPKQDSMAVGGRQSHSHLDEASARLKRPWICALRNVSSDGVQMVPRAYTHTPHRLHSLLVCRLTDQ
ncbi:hypothetical protein E2C01_076321 [Portunus trituberculatus]|uniref:Uncharacterized protein n=1 Tax=Portunus trituberculatus TaxID=210409 RepID=A0A5B7IB52_PORTR|nr:hypothetical protein [Portunus trituberculatus]